MSLVARTLSACTLFVTVGAAAAEPGAPRWELTGAHARHEAALLGALPPRDPGPAPLPAVTRGPDVLVYGYLAYWANDLTTVPWDQLSHLAIFNAGVTTTGALTDTSRWSITEDALAIAATYGVRVHLCVTNFVPAELTTLLSSATARQTLIDNLVTWKTQTGAHGINIDFEGLPAAQRANMVQFVKDLEAAVGEVVLATPAVDWSSAWDYATLSEHADLFIMGYGYHWSGSTQAGPNDPLWGASPWSRWSLDWTVQDYLDKGADPERVILGLPLYGNRWPVQSSAVPAATTGTGSSIVWRLAKIEANTYGRSFDEPSETPWWYDGTRQGWYSDTDSLRLRVRYAVDEGIGGIGFWALNYEGDDPTLWPMIAEETTFDEPDPGDTADPDDTGDTEDEPPADPSFHADAGSPFLAYVGDLVILSGARSTGPEPLVYEWTQTSGPSVTLRSEQTVEPSFRVRRPGTHVFALRVGDGERWSAPARSHVVVLDPGYGSRYGCGCDANGTRNGLALPLVALLIARRRRR